MAAFVHKYLIRLKNALIGVFFAVRTDMSFRLQVVLGILFSIFGYLVRPLSDFEMFSLVLSWVLILITELQNTSFETALDRLHPEMHDSIGKSKDMAAGAVLLAAFFALFVIVHIILKRI